MDKMDKKTLFAIAGLALSVLTLLFGDNIYERITGQSIFEILRPAKQSTQIVQQVVIVVTATPLPTLIQPTAKNVLPAILPTETPKPLSSTNTVVPPTPTEASQLSPSFYFERGANYHQNGQYDNAISDLKTCIQVDASFSDCYNVLGMSYREKGDFSQSLGYHDKAIQLNSTRPDFFLERGVTYHRMKNFAQAISDFNTCIQIDNRFSLCYNALGMAYREIGDFAQSLLNHDKAIAINPRYDFYFERGVTYHQLRSEYDKAIQDFKTCIEKNASFCNCYTCLGMAYRDKGDFTTALPYHNKAIELCPTRADFYWERGVTYQRVGNTSQADDDFKKARELGYDR